MNNELLYVVLRGLLHNVAMFSMYNLCYFGRLSLLGDPRLALASSALRNVTHLNSVQSPLMWRSGGELVTASAQQRGAVCQVNGDEISKF